MTQQHLAPHLEAWQIDDAQADKNQAPSLEAEAEKHALRLALAGFAHMGGNGLDARNPGGAEPTT
jgi:hypothetical protein